MAGITKKVPSYTSKTIQLPNAMRRQMKYLIEEGFFINMSELMRTAISLLIRDCMEQLQKEDIEKNDLLIKV